jgi:hypothetical protein
VKTFALVLVMVSCAAPVAAHETITTKLTWTREISRLVYARCTSCHKPGGAAPMSFYTYDETRPWAKAIQEEVSERRMPPWDAVKGFGEFQHEASLTPEEIKLFNDWVEGGAPKGDDKYLPPLPIAKPAPKPAAPASQLIARQGTLLPRDALLLGLRPQGLKPGASLVATAELPDGAVEPLLWIRNFKATRNRTYLLAEPLRLPRGTRIQLEGAGQLLLHIR